MHPALGEDGDRVHVGCEQLVQRADRAPDSEPLGDHPASIRQHLRQDHLTDQRVGREQRDELAGEGSASAEDPDLHGDVPGTRYLIPLVETFST